MTRLSLVLLAGVAVLGAASTAQAADLIIDDTAPVGIVETSGGNWDGPFIGGFVGFGGATVGDVDEIEEIDDLDLTGWFAGVNVGTNFSLGNGIVAGIVGDIAWADINDDDDDGDEEAGYSIDWQGSLRGRLGFDGGAFMPYLTAGLAVAGTDSDFFDDDAGTARVGWTAGAGVELAVSDNMSIDLLYRFSDYGDEEYEIGDDEGTDTLDLTSHTVQVGLNFKF